MKLKFTRGEFLAQWRMMRGFAPLRNDAAVTRTDGIDLDSLLEAEMDAWYRRLIRDGDGDTLVAEELAGDIILPEPSEGCVTVSLPPEVARVLTVRLSGWRCPATVVTDPESATALRQLHPYTRAGADSPVAVSYPDSRLALYPATAFDTLDTLQCVMLRDDEFVMDSSALNLIGNLSCEKSMCYEK